MKVEKSRLDAYLKRIHPTSCPLCGKSSWTVSDIVFQSPEFNDGEHPIGRASFPMIPLACENCGNTYFINALVAKLVDPQKGSSDIIGDETKEQGEHDE